jgi:hypothetical protein
MTGGGTPAWRSVVLGVAISAGVIGIAVAGGVAFFISRHHDSEIVSRATADAEFARLRHALGNQPPLVDVHDNGDPVMNRTFTAPAPEGAALRTLHTVVFESRSGKLVRIELPFRIVRLMHAKGFTYLGGFTFLEDTEFDSDRVLLTLDDLERRGRGVVVDHRHPAGGQFLVWIE